MLDCRVRVQFVQRRRLSGDGQVHRREEGLRPSPLHGITHPGWASRFFFLLRITQYVIFLCSLFLFCVSFCSFCVRLDPFCVRSGSSVCVNRVVITLAESEHPETIRAWLLATNPQLGDRAPIEQLRDGDSVAVLHAAINFIEATT